MLASACSNPINRWAYEDETDMVSLGVSLLFAIARNHPFAQGNKRTAFVAFTIFLSLNGRPLALPDDTEAAIMVEQVIARQQTVEAFERYISAFVLADRP